MGFTPEFKITQTDGQVLDIKTGAVDLVRWEKKNGKSFIGGDPTIEQLLWIAWAAGIRQKIIADGYAQKFEGWLEIVDDLDRVDEDEDESKDPTPEGSPPTDSAS
jgi:hypothetical protein